MSKNLDFEHLNSFITQSINDAVIKDNTMKYNGTCEFYKSENSKTYFSTIMINEEEYYFIVYWTEINRASITKASTKDDFEDDTHDSFAMFRMFETEEEHFMQSTVRNVTVPFETMKNIKIMMSNLDERRDLIA